MEHTLPGLKRCAHPATLWLLLMHTPISDVGCNHMLMVGHTAGIVALGGHYKTLSMLICEYALPAMRAGSGRPNSWTAAQQQHLRSARNTRAAQSQGFNGLINKGKQ